MKTIIQLLAIAIFSGCYSAGEIQVEMVSVRLIRVDTINRYNERDIKQLLTWKDDRDLEYISYEPLQCYFNVGSRMMVMKTK